MSDQPTSRPSDTRQNINDGPIEFDDYISMNRAALEVFFRSMLKPINDNETDAKGKNFIVEENFSFEPLKRLYFQDFYRSLLSTEKMYGMVKCDPVNDTWTTNDGHTKTVVANSVKIQGNTEIGDLDTAINSTVGAMDAVEIDESHFHSTIEFTENASNRNVGLYDYGKLPGVNASGELFQLGLLEQVFKEEEELFKEDIRREHNIVSYQTIARRLTELFARLSNIRLSMLFWTDKANNYSKQWAVAALDIFYNLMSRLSEAHRINLQREYAGVQTTIEYTREEVIFTERDNRPLNVLIWIDASASMTNHIKELTKKIKSVVEYVKNEVNSDCKIGFLIGRGDKWEYPYKGSATFCCNFTNNTTILKNALEKYTGGGDECIAGLMNAITSMQKRIDSSDSDNPHDKVYQYVNKIKYASSCVYVWGNATTKKLQWDPGAKRIVIVFSDEPVDNYTSMCARKERKHHKDSKYNTKWDLMDDDGNFDSKGTRQKVNQYDNTTYTYYCLPTKGAYRTYNPSDGRSTNPKWVVCPGWQFNNTWDWHTGSSSDPNNAQKVKLNWKNTRGDNPEFTRAQFVNAFINPGLPVNADGTHAEPTAQQLRNIKENVTELHWVYYSSGTGKSDCIDNFKTLITNDILIPISKANNGNGASIINATSKSNLATVLKSIFKNRSDEWEVKRIKEIPHEKKKDIGDPAAVGLTYARAARLNKTYADMMRPCVFVPNLVSAMMMLAQSKMVEDGKLPQETPHQDWSSLLGKVIDENKGNFTWFGRTNEPKKDQQGNIILLKDGMYVGPNQSVGRDEKTALNEGGNYAESLTGIHLKLIDKPTGAGWSDGTGWDSNDIKKALTGGLQILADAFIECLNDAEVMKVLDMSTSPPTPTNLPELMRVKGGNLANVGDLQFSLMLERIIAKVYKALNVKSSSYFRGNIPMLNMDFALRFLTDSTIKNKNELFKQDSTKYRKAYSNVVDYVNRVNDWKNSKRQLDEDTDYTLNNVVTTMQNSTRLLNPSFAHMLEEWSLCPYRFNESGSVVSNVGNSSAETEVGPTNSYGVSYSKKAPACPFAETVMPDYEVNLPYDAEVEYIESSGTQYIDMGMSYSAPMEFNAVISSTVPLTTSNILYGASTVTNRLYTGWSSATKIDLGMGGGVASPAHTQSLSQGQQFSLVVRHANQRSVTLNDELLWTGGNQPAPSDTIWLFGSRRGGGNNTMRQADSFKGRLYSFQVRMGADWTLAHDFVPVRVGNEYCLYDRANPTGGDNGDGLYHNKGSGVFLGGKDIIKTRPHGCALHTVYDVPDTEVDGLVDKLELIPPNCPARTLVNGILQQLRKQPQRIPYENSPQYIHALFKAVDARTKELIDTKKEESKSMGYKSSSAIYEHITYPGETAPPSPPTYKDEVHSNVRLVYLDQLIRLCQDLFRVNMDIAFEEPYLKTKIERIDQHYYGSAAKGSFEPITCYRFTNFHALNDQDARSAAGTPAKYQLKYYARTLGPQWVTAINRDLSGETAVSNSIWSRIDSLDNEKTIEGTDDIESSKTYTSFNSYKDPNPPAGGQWPIYEKDGNKYMLTKEEIISGIIDPGHDIKNISRANDAEYPFYKIHLMDELVGIVKDNNDDSNKTTSLTTFEVYVKRFRPIYLPNADDLFVSEDRDPLNPTADGVSIHATGWSMVPHKYSADAHLSKDAIIIPMNFGSRNSPRCGWFSELDYAFHKIVVQGDVAISGFYDEVNDRITTKTIVGKEYEDFYKYHYRDWLWPAAMMGHCHVSGDNGALATITDSIEKIRNADGPTGADGANDYTQGVKGAVIVQDNGDSDKNLVVTESNLKYFDIFKCADASVGQDTALNANWLYITTPAPGGGVEVSQCEFPLPWVFFHSSRGSEGAGPSNYYHGLGNRVTTNHETSFHDGQPNGMRFFAVDNVLSQKPVTMNLYGRSDVTLDNAGAAAFSKGFYDPSCCGTEETWHTHNSGYYGWPNGSNDKDGPRPDKYYLQYDSKGNNHVTGGTSLNSACGWSEYYSYKDGKVMRSPFNKYNEGIMETLKGKPMTWSLWNVVRHSLHRCFNVVDLDYDEDRVGCAINRTTLGATPEELEYKTGQSMRAMYKEWYQRFTYNGQYCSKSIPINPETGMQDGKNVAWPYKVEEDDPVDYIHAQRLMNGNGTAMSGGTCQIEWTNLVADMSIIYNEVSDTHNSCLTMYTGGHPNYQMNNNYHSTGENEFRGPGGAGEAGSGVQSTTIPTSTWVGTSAYPNADNSKPFRYALPAVDMCRNFMVLTYRGYNSPIPDEAYAGGVPKFEPHHSHPKELMVSREIQTTNHNGKALSRVSVTADATEYSAFDVLLDDIYPPSEEGDTEGCDSNFIQRLLVPCYPNWEDLHDSQGNPIYPDAVSDDDLKKIVFCVAPITYYNGLASGNGSSNKKNWKLFIGKDGKKHIKKGDGPAQMGERMMAFCVAQFFMGVDAEKMTSNLDTEFFEEIAKPNVCVIAPNLGHDYMPGDPAWGQGLVDPGNWDPSKWWRLS